MAATVFNQARVSSKKVASGEIVYLFEENTRCIKDPPKMSEWSAMKFGLKADIVARIYQLAASIPGGMLKVGGKSPSAFVSDMLALLDDPGEMFQTNATFENSESRHSAISDGNRQQVMGVLSRMGRTDLAGRVSKSPKEGGDASISLDLETESEIVMELMNKMRYDDPDGTWRFSGIPAWHAFQSYWINRSDRGPNEAVEQSAVIEKPDVRIFESAIDVRYRPDDAPELIHLLTVDGKVVYVGKNDYSLEVAFLNTIKVKHLETGVCPIKKWYGALRAAQKVITKLPRDCTFKFRLASDNKWVKENYFGVAKIIKGDSVGNHFEATNEQLSEVAAKTSQHMRYLLIDAKSYTVEVEGFEPVEEVLF